MALRRKSEVQRETRQILGTLVQPRRRLTKAQLGEIPVNGESRVRSKNSLEMMRRVVHQSRRRGQRGSLVEPLGEKRLRVFHRVAMANRRGGTTRVVYDGHSSCGRPHDVAQECDCTTLDFHGSVRGALVDYTTQRTHCRETAWPEPNHATRELDRCVTPSRGRSASAMPLEKRIEVPRSAETTGREYVQVVPARRTSTW